MRKKRLDNVRIGPHFRESNVDGVELHSPHDPKQEVLLVTCQVTCRYTFVSLCLLLCVVPLQNKNSNIL